MPPLTDPAILAMFRLVLAEWRCTGYVTAKDTALDWITNNLGGLTLRDVAQALHHFVQSGGTIDQQPERRPEWNQAFPLRLSPDDRFANSLRGDAFAR